MIQTQERFCSMAATCETIGWRTCAASLQLSSRNRCCCPRRSLRTLPMHVPKPRRTRSSGPPGQPMRISSSSRCPTVSPHVSANVACDFRAGNVSESRLPAAFLRDAPVLVLDEPTSSVDGQTEAGIMEAMERLMKGRTTFMIAHRLSTLRHCDLLLRIAAGQVVEQTTAVAEVLAAEQRSSERPATAVVAGFRGT